MQRDMHNNVDDRVALNIQAISTDTTTAGAIIDTAGYESIEFIIQSATLTDGTYTAVLQDGDDSGLSDAANVASDFVLGTLPVFALTEDNVTKRVGAVPKKRYIRLSLTSASTSSGGTLGAVAVLGKPHSAPVAQ
jgi:hypothetical protein